MGKPEKKHVLDVDLDHLFRESGAVNLYSAYSRGLDDGWNKCIDALEEWEKERPPPGRWWREFRPSARCPGCGRKM